jgi:hypothetical protein
MHFGSCVCTFNKIKVEAVMVRRGVFIDEVRPEVYIIQDYGNNKW